MDNVLTKLKNLAIKRKSGSNRPASAPSGEHPLSPMALTSLRSSEEWESIDMERKPIKESKGEVKIVLPIKIPVESPVSSPTTDPQIPPFSPRALPPQKPKLVPVIPLHQVKSESTSPTSDDYGDANMDVDARPVNRTTRSYSTPKALEQKDRKPKSILKPSPQLKSVTLKALDLHLAKDKALLPSDKKVICRICEEEIQAALLKEHTKFCVIANTWDMIAIANDSQLHKITMQINEKLEEAIRDQNNPNSPRGGKVDVELLKTLQKIASSASSSADIVQCIKLLVGLREQKKNDNIEEIAKEMEALLKEKINALRNAEMAVNSSPRLYRTDSPRALRSPRPTVGQGDKHSPEPARGMPTIHDFHIIKTITEGAFGRVYLARKKEN